MRLAGAKRISQGLGRRWQHLVFIAFVFFAPFAAYFRV